MLILQDAAGAVVGAAQAIHSPLLTNNGESKLTTLDRLSMPEPRAPGLRAIAQAAGRQWKNGEPMTIVFAPNLSTIDRGVIQASGFRKTSAQFDCHLATRVRRHPFANAVGTSLSIV
jgi:hypothetical protein